MKALNKSCRVVHIEGQDKERQLVEKHGGRAVYCTFHQRMFYHFHHFGLLHVTMMISRSKDGEWATRIARRLGFKEVRGSTKKGNRDKGGSEAMAKLIEEVKKGESAGMLVDGPRGPARQVRMGSVLIAKETGAPMMSEMWGCDRAWVINSWDRFIIPKPFAKIFIIHGDPIYVPPDSTSEQLEQFRLQLEQSMNADCQRCDDYFGVTRPNQKEPKTS